MCAPQLQWITNRKRVQRIRHGHLCEINVAMCKLFLLCRRICSEIRFVSDTDPVRRKIVLTIALRVYGGAGSRKVAVVGSGFVGQPRSPPTVTSRRLYHCVACGHQRHIESGIFTFRVDHADVETVPEYRVQCDGFLGPR